MSEGDDNAGVSVVNRKLSGWKEVILLCVGRTISVFVARCNLSQNVLMLEKQQGNSSQLQTLTFVCVYLYTHTLSLPQAQRFLLFSSISYWAALSSIRHQRAIHNSGSPTWPLIPVDYSCNTLALDSIFYDEYLYLCLCSDLILNWVWMEKWQDVNSASTVPQPLLHHSRS